MNKSGDIVIIEDDHDDQELIRYAYESKGYPNKLVFFDDPKEAFRYLQREDVFPFIVMSDINMPILDGFELRRKIFEDDVLRKKCIPYIFFTTGANLSSVSQAYELSVQGFFIKPNSIDELQEIIGRIVDYWLAGVAPHGYRF